MTTKRDYYEVLERRPHGVRRGNQARLSQARGQISSRQESGRPARRREIQGTRRSLRRPDRCRKSAPPTIASVMPPSRKVTRAAAGSTIHSIFSAKSSAAAERPEFSKLFSAAARRRRSGRPAARFRFALRHADHARGSGFRRGKGNRSSQARHLRQVPWQRRGSRFARDQLSDLRRTRPGHQFARIFPGLANLSALPRRRADHRETVSRLRRRRAASKKPAGSN